MYPCILFAITFNTNRPKTCSIIKLHLLIFFSSQTPVCMNASYRKHLSAWMLLIEKTSMYTQLNFFVLDNVTFCNSLKKGQTPWSGGSSRWLETTLPLTNEGWLVRTALSTMTLKIRQFLTDDGGLIFIFLAIASQITEMMLKGALNYKDK